MKTILAVALLAVMTVPASAQTDTAEQAGIAEFTKSWTASVADYDNDGWPDFVLSRHYGGGAQLFHNEHGSFAESYRFPDREANNLPVDRHDCEWADVNRDGLLDLYCTKGADYGTGRKENELWIANRFGFTNEAVKYGVSDPWGRGRFCAFIDVNHDHWPDLFVANEAGRADGEDSRNHLFINEHGTGFRSAPEYGLDLAIGGGQCVKNVDVDNDGWDDLLVCAGGSYPRIYRNNHGLNFTDISLNMGMSGHARDALLVDLNGDGQLDLVTVNKSLFKVRLQRDGVFQSPSFTLGMTAGEKLAAGDINRDGLPDIYICQGGDRSSGVNLDYNPKDIMLLNNGDGQFSRIAIPEAWRGQGQHVSPIDYDQDGKTDFIVLNGFNTHEGPVQLITFSTPAIRTAARIVRSPTEQHGGSGGRGPLLPMVIHAISEPDGTRRLPERERRGP